MRGRQAGFTLLEVLIVVLISSLLIGTAVQTYIALARATKRTLAENRRDAVAALVLDRLESELVGTLLLKHGKDEELDKFPWIFLGEGGGPGERASDSIRFVTQTPARAAGSLSGVGLRLVSYTVRTTEGDREGLFRAEESLPAAAPEPPAYEPTPAVEDVFKLKIRYKDKDGQLLEGWNSRGDPNDNDLPMAVELTLQLEEKDAEGEYKTGRELTRLVALPLRPIGDDDDEDSDKVCPNAAKTIKQCADEFQTEISGLDPQVKAKVEAIISQNGDKCANDGSAKAAFDQLNDLVKQGGADKDLSEVCL